MWGSTGSGSVPDAGLSNTIQLYYERITPVNAHTTYYRFQYKVFITSPVYYHTSRHRRSRIKSQLWMYLRLNAE